jgi:hypothetical protein
MLGGTHWNPSEPVGTCWDPFEPVETRSDLLKHVQTCWNTFRPVETTRFQASPPPPPSPLPLLPLPLFPFLLGGKGRGEGGGGRGREGEHYHGPPEEGGTKSPPLRILTTKKKLFSLSLSSLCVIYPRGFSQSTAQNYINLCYPLIHSFIHSLWHTEMIWNLKKPPPKYYYY